MSTAEGRVRSVLEEERDFFLRSLRDLDAERDAGDLDEVDYQALRSDYVTRAASVLRRLRALDEGGLLTEPEASEVGTGPEASGVGTGLEASEVGTGPEASGVGTGPEAGEVGAAPAGAGAPRRRRWRRPTAIAGAAVVVAAGIGWSVVAATGTRLPGGVVSGQAVGQEKVAKLLLAGQQAAAKGDGVTALKDLDAVLAQNPNQVEALSAAGWILVQTRRPDLLKQGLGMITKAERINPAYPPAHLYAGIGYMTEDDYPDAVPQLQWYLSHGPDPSLAPQIRQALAQAQAGTARVGGTPAGSTGSAGG